MHSHAQEAAVALHDGIKAMRSALKGNTMAKALVNNFTRDVELSYRGQRSAKEDAFISSSKACYEDWKKENPACAAAWDARKQLEKLDQEEVEAIRYRAHQEKAAMRQEAKALKYLVMNGADGWSEAGK